ncbi:MAG: hypothetical protein K0U41_06465 [Gammaproteobacteria bacterium]|nr:hypothetical protein [Gammaproteobacteria bacterium]
MVDAPPKIELVTVPFTYLTKDDVPFHHSVDDTTFLITYVRKRSYKVSYYYLRRGKHTAAVIHGTYSTLNRAVDALNYLYTCRLLRLSRDQGLEKRKEIAALSKKLHKFDVLLNRTE